MSGFPSNTDSVFSHMEIPLGWGSAPPAPSHGAVFPDLPPDDCYDVAICSCDEDSGESGNPLDLKVISPRLELFDGLASIHVSLGLGETEYGIGSKGRAVRPSLVQRIYSPSLYSSLLQAAGEYLDDCEMSQLTGFGFKDVQHGYSSGSSSVAFTWGSSSTDTDEDPSHPEDSDFAEFTISPKATTPNQEDPASPSRFPGCFVTEFSAADGHAEEPFNKQTPFEMAKNEFERQYPQLASLFRCVEVHPNRKRPCGYEGCQDIIDVRRKAFIIRHFQSKHKRAIQLGYEKAKASIKSGKKRIACVYPECKNHDYSNLSGLGKHISEKHHALKYACGVCAATFTREHTANRHLINRVCDKETISQVLEDLARENPEPRAQSQCID